VANPTAAQFVKSWVKKAILQGPDLPMPNLAREQALEQLNRLFPAGRWTVDDLEQAEVMYGAGDEISGPFRMWVPLHSPHLATLVRWRLNVPAHVVKVDVRPVSGSQQAL